MDLAKTQEMLAINADYALFKSIRTLVVCALVGIGTAPALAAGPTAFGPSLPIDDPTFCFGENKLGQCVLFFGSGNSCKNITPCTNTSVPSRREVANMFGHATLAINANTFCYGWNETSNQCQLYYGTKEACASLPACSVQLVPFEQ